MARKLISGNDVLSFNPTDGTIIANGYIPLSKILLINNATNNVPLFNFSDPNTLASVTYNSSNNTTLIDVTYNTSLMNSNDEIQIYYEKDELEMKPARTYRDPVSKFRVSNPQTLIDTDFEYGQQPTKWESLKLINNVPTSHSSPFTENSLLPSSIKVSIGDNIMNIQTTDAHGLSLGSVIEVANLSDSKYEGTFIVKTIPEIDKFSVKLSFNSDSSKELKTIYSTIYKGAFYTGSSIAVNDVFTSTGAASTLTVSTPNIHGFKDRTKLYLKNSRATKKYEFNVPNDVIGFGTTSFKSEISGIGGSPEFEYYSFNKIITEEIIGKTELSLADTDIDESTGEITYNINSQIGKTSEAGISTDSVLIFYTPEGNSPISNTIDGVVSNFTPFRVLSSVSVPNQFAGGEDVTLTINSSYNNSIPFVADNNGTTQFGSHRFIRGYRIVKFNYLTIEFDEEVDFESGDRIILNTNYPTITYSYWESTVTNAFITKYNGQYNTATNPYWYFIYTVNTVSSDKKVVTVNTTVSYSNATLSLTSYPFRNIDVKNHVTYGDFIWSASSIKDHPLANSLYLEPSVGFSTDLYDDYQYVLYRNESAASRLPSLADNTNYILKRVNDDGWYKIYQASHNNDNSSTWDTPINLYFNPTGNGSAANVFGVGIHTITSISKLKNSNTISIPNRGGLENNAIVTYNTEVSPIGNLVANENYKIKIEDDKLDSNSFRLSTTSNYAKVYAIVYSANASTVDFYIYDLEDRTNFNSTADDGIKSAGIVIGNTIQVSGSEYPNPIKKQFINNNFVVNNIVNYSYVPKLDAGSPANTLRYIYRVILDVPQDGTFNTKTAISINDSQTYGSSALGNIKVTSIRPLDISDGDTVGTHIFTQNINGAVDDVYEVEESSENGFVFNTLAEIPEITKNITPFQNIISSAVSFDESTKASQITISNNGQPNSSISFTHTANGPWCSVVSSNTFTAPFSISFVFESVVSYYTTFGLTTNSPASNLTYLNAQHSVIQYNWAGTRWRWSRNVNTWGAGESNNINGTDVFKIAYDADGYVRYYRNGVLFDTNYSGLDKEFRIYFSTLNYISGMTSGVHVKNISIGDLYLPFDFVGGTTNYLKLSGHNFADGTQVTYQVEPPEGESVEDSRIKPLENNTTYYVRVLDENFVGLTSSVIDAIDRSKSVIGFTTSGISSASHKLVTTSIRGFLSGNGSIAISTSSSLIKGKDTSFLSDFSNGDVFRIYKTSTLGIEPGEYFESKISSIKSDNILRIESIPSFETTDASYFKQTSLYPITDGKVLHRPFDGGVSMHTGLIPNSKVIRQTRRYFRYQSGKGIQVSMAVNFNPTYDIDRITQVGTGLTSHFNIKSKFPHNISSDTVISNQRIIVSNVEGFSASNLNATIDQEGYPILNIVDDFNFTIDSLTPISIGDIAGFPQYTIKNWQGASIKSGLFDDQNGFFFEYDGETLYAVRRSSTQQISGSFQLERNSNLIQGVNSSLLTQVSGGNYVVIRGQTYKIISVIGDSSMYIQPAYRGNSTSDVIISKVIDTKVPQSQWNIDRMDGTGESGYNIDISKIQMIYMDYSWYGAGSVRFGFKDQNGEVKYAHEFIHNNIFTESYFRSGNIPARYEVETFDDPLYSPSLSHWGVSVIMDGRYDDDKAYLFTGESKTLPFTNDGYSSVFSGRVTSGSEYITDITAAEYSSLVVGEELVYLVSGSANYNYLQPGTKIESLEIDSSTINNRLPNSQRYKIKITKPAIAGTNTNLTTLYAFSGTSANLQSSIPLVSIRLAPSVDNGNIGNLGFRDIITRMQLTLKSAGVLTTHDSEVQLILNAKLSDESYEAVTSPSLSQLYKHNVGDSISTGIVIFAFRAQGGSILNSTTGRRSLSGTEVSLKELALLGNSILGGDGTFPDGPDVLTIAVRPIDTSTINGQSPMIVTGRITWTEAQA